MHLPRLICAISCLIWGCSPAVETPSSHPSQTPGQATAIQTPSTSLIGTASPSAIGFSPIETASPTQQAMASQTPSTTVFPPENTTAQPTQVVELQNKLTLRWLRSQNDDAFEDVLRGLNWALSTLGAIPPMGNGAYQIVEDGPEGVIFEVDFTLLGAPDYLSDQLIHLAKDLRAGDEYRLFGAVDVGHFLMRSVFEPEFYYAATKACADLQGWKAQKVETPVALFPVTQSLLVSGDRLLSFNDTPQDILEIAHLATEGVGEIADGSFEPVEFETVDILSNGRQRFAVYDLDGRLMPGADPLKSPAGLPGNCMWCHEYHLQKGSAQNESLPGFMDYETFLGHIVAQDQLFFDLRNGHETAVDFSNPQEHAPMEWLGEFYLRPSLQRVAAEWGIAEARVAAIAEMEGWPSTLHGEYPQRGPLYFRQDVSTSFETHFSQFNAEADWPHGGQLETSYQAPIHRPSARHWDGALDWTQWQAFLDTLEPCE